MLCTSTGSARGPRNALAAEHIDSLLAWPCQLQPGNHIIPLLPPAAGTSLTNWPLCGWQHLASMPCWHKSVESGPLWIQTTWQLQRHYNRGMSHAFFSSIGASAHGAGTAKGGRRCRLCKKALSKEATGPVPPWPPSPPHECMNSSAVTEPTCTCHHLTTPCRRMTALVAARHAVWQQVAMRLGYAFHTHSPPSGTVASSPILDRQASDMAK